MMRPICIIVSGLRVLLRELIVEFVTLWKSKAQKILKYNLKFDKMKNDSFNVQWNIDCFQHHFHRFHASLALKIEEELNFKYLRGYLQRKSCKGNRKALNDTGQTDLLYQLNFNMLWHWILFSRTCSLRFPWYIELIWVLIQVNNLTLIVLYGDSVKQIVYCIPLLIKKFYLKCFN